MHSSQRTGIKYEINNNVFRLGLAAAILPVPLMHYHRTPCAVLAPPGPIVVVLVAAALAAVVLTVCIKKAITMDIKELADLVILGFDGRFDTQDDGPLCTSMTSSSTILSNSLCNLSLK